MKNKKAGYFFSGSGRLGFQPNNCPPKILIPASHPLPGLQRTLAPIGEMVDHDHNGILLTLGTGNPVIESRLTSSQGATGSGSGMYNPWGED
uniref:Uncharacterized protein n=1 Tax=Helianthus annuus TaxID=4232 RepID=A0A251VQE5_HELAN